MRDDDLGPGQRFAEAAIEVCNRIITNDNSVTIRWVSAHKGATGNEVANQYAKSAATGEDPVEAIPEGYADETSLSHMSRVATEAGSREMREWIMAHVRPERRYRPSGEGPQQTTTSAGQKDPCRPLLPAPIGACGDGDTPETVREDRHGRVLVVHEWRGAVEAPPVHAVPRLLLVVDGAEAQTVEGLGEGVRVGEAAHPISEILVRRQSGGGGFRVPADHEGWVHRSGEGPPGGQGGGDRWRGGGPRSALDCIFPFLFSLVRFHLLPGTRVEVSFVFRLSFLVVVGGPTMTGKTSTGAREKVIYVNSHCRLL